MKRFKKALSVWLSLALLLSSVPVPNFAGAASPVDVSLLNLTEIIPAPVRGAASNTTTTINTAQYTGTIEWRDAMGLRPAPAIFEASTVYMAGVRLTLKEGYTLINLREDSFTHDNASWVFNDISSKKIYLTFNPTAAAPDTTPPAIADGFPNVTDIAQTSANVKFNVNEVSTIYTLLKHSGIPTGGMSEIKSYGSAKTISAGQLNSDVVVSQSSLTPSTSYTLYYFIEDLTGNTTSVGHVDFTTTTPDVTSPTFANGFPNVINVAHDSATAQFNIDEVGTIEFMLKLSVLDSPDLVEFGQSATLVSIDSNTVNTAVSRNLASLTPESSYKLYYRATDSANNSTGIEFITFITDSLPDTTPPVIAQGMPTVTIIGTATAMFNVNINETGTVEYVVKPASQNAPSTEEFSISKQTVSISTANTLVTQALSSLTPGTQYKIYYRAKDLNSNSTLIANITFTTTSVTAPPSSGGGGGGGGNSTPTPSGPPANPTQSKPIDVIVNGVNKPAGTLITGVTDNGQHKSTVAVSSTGVADQLGTPVATGKPSVVVNVPQASTPGVPLAYSAELTGTSANAMASASASLSVRTPLSDIVLSDGALESLNQTLTRLAGSSAPDASIAVSASQAPASTRPSSVASQPLVSALTSPVQYTTEVVTGGTRIPVSDYNSFVTRTLQLDAATSQKAVQAGLSTIDEAGRLRGTQGVVYINGSAYPVPTVRTPNGATISSITNSVYDLIFYFKDFEDTKGHKYEASITNMASRLVVTGVSDTKFDPDSKVTRAEFATMITRALGLYRGELGKSTFKDLTKIKGLNVGITIAADRGIVKGMSRTDFEPNKNINAKEMAQILFNVVNRYGDVNTFVDKASVVKTKDWSKNAVAFASKKGLIESFSADKEMTRAEAAYAIEQMLKGMNLIDK